MNRHACSPYLALLGVLCLGLTACGKKDDTTNDTKDMSVDMNTGPQACTTAEDCTGAAAGYECVGEVCTDCERGALDCSCFANGTCEAGFVCGDESLCVACVPGEEDCPCDNGSCGDGLTCSGDSVCVPDTCSPGDLDCPCDNGSCNGISDYCNGMDMCKPCSSDIEGCACDVNSACQGDLFCDDETLCQVCPESDKPSGCECATTSDCASGLACDETNGVCRTRSTCDELCLPFQACDESLAGDPVCLPDTCIDGYSWNGTACVEAAAENCDGRGGAVDKSPECDAQGKACVELAQMKAVCVDTCDTIGEMVCGLQNRDCDENERDEDATCGACRPGFIDDGLGSCVRDAMANCAPLGAVGSIANLCADRNQLCVPDASGAYCGDCLNSGYIFDVASNACVESSTCGGVVCGSDEFCEYPQTGGLPACTPIPGMCGVNEAYDRDTSACVACAEMCDDEGTHPVAVNGECVCASDYYCAYQYDGAGDRCVTPPEVCADGQSQTPQGQCQDCNLACSAEGERGRSWVYTSRDGTCVCDTQEGFYIPAGGAGSTVRCDADGDGWINSTAYDTYKNAFTNGDQAILANFRCDLRQIDRFTLINEWGQRRHVSLCPTGFVDYAPGEMTRCPDNANGTPGADFTRLVLVEPNTLDSDDAIKNEGLIPNYNAVDRQMRAAELNALTKGCVTSLNDYNLNGVQDLVESQLIGLDRKVGGSSDESFAFDSMSYFIELHSGRYIPPANAADAGQYVIQERSRCDTSSFPLQYTTVGNYWRQCERSRRGDYDASSPSYVGFDFAAWGCDTSQGTCPIQAPVDTGMDLDGDRILDHGLCDQSAALPDTPWRGMNHHSQFQCVQIVTTVDPPEYERQKLELFQEGTVNSGVLQFNSCVARSCAPGMMNCQESTSQGVLQPSITELDCMTVNRDDVLTSDVGWVAARYTPEGKSPSNTRPYLRGCVDESIGTQNNDHYKTLCPGYNENPDGVLTAGNPGDAGKLICACNRFFAGERCEYSCASPTLANSTLLHVGGGIGMGSLYDMLTLDQRTDFACGDDGYCSLVPREAAEAVRMGFPGGRYGYWMCGDINLLSTFDVQGNLATELVESPAAPASGYSIQGKLGLAPVDRKQGLASEADACKPYDPNDPNSTINSGYCIY